MPVTVIGAGPLIVMSVPLPVDVIKPPAAILTPWFKLPSPFKPPAVPVTVTRPPAEAILGVVLPVPSVLRDTPWLVLALPVPSPPPVPVTVIGAVPVDEASAPDSTNTP